MREPREKKGNGQNRVVRSRVQDWDTRRIRKNITNIGLFYAWNHNKKYLSFPTKLNKLDAWTTRYSSSTKHIISQYFVFTECLVVHLGRTTKASLDGSKKLWHVKLLSFSWKLFWEYLRFLLFESYKLRFAQKE